MVAGFVKCNIATELYCEHNGNIGERKMAKAVILSRPACAIGCSPCWLECAVLRERANWWQAEVCRLMAELALARNPVAALSDHLQAAQDAYAALMRRLAATPQMAAPPVTRHGSPAASAPALLH